MKVTMQVVLETPDGDKTDAVTADARDIRNYEAQFGQSWVTTETSFTQMTQLAFVAMKRLGKFTGSYDVFDSVCVEVSDVPESDPEPERPTPKAHGGGRSRSS